MAEFASNGVANAGLATGIIGTALGVLNGGAGILGMTGLGNGNNATSNYVTKDELKFVQDIAAKDSQIALLQSENNTETKMIEVYKQAHEEVAALRDSTNAKFESQYAWNTQQSVNNATMAASISANANSIAALNNTINSVTKTVIPNSSVMPGWGDVTVSPTSSGCGCTGTTSLY